MRIPICRRFLGASVLALVPVIGGAQPLATTPPPAGAKAAAPKVPAATRPPKPESAARDLVVELRVLEETGAAADLPEHADGLRRRIETLRRDALRDWLASRPSIEGTESS